MNTPEDRLKQLELVVKDALALLEEFGADGKDTKPVEEYLRFLESKRKAYLRRKLPR